MVKRHARKILVVSIMDEMLVRVGICTERRMEDGRARR